VYALEVPVTTSPLGIRPWWRREVVCALWIESVVTRDWLSIDNTAGLSFS
jgi:hypothetical protein